MNTELMKTHLIAAYPGNDHWKKNVIKMPPFQVLKIYNKFVIEGKIKGA